MNIQSIAADLAAEGSKITLALSVHLNHPELRPVLEQSADVLDGIAADARDLADLLDPEEPAAAEEPAAQEPATDEPPTTGRRAARA